MSETQTEGVDFEGRCKRCGCRVVVESGEDAYWTTEIARELMAHQSAGATLRDRFAMAALTGLLAGAPPEDTGYSWDPLAYEIADAMLAEREKGDS